MTPKPKRVTPKKETANDFHIEPVSLDLDFFVRKGHTEYTVEQFVNELFGKDGLRLTEAEKVYYTLKALEDLELVMPFEFDCPNCQTPNPMAVEVAKVMKMEGTSHNQFTIEFDGLIFEFERPEIIHNPPGDGLADVGLFIVQWLTGTNQGEDFDFKSLKIPQFIKLARNFADFMVRTTFEVEGTCFSCSSHFVESFTVSMEDITALVNHL